MKWFKHFTDSHSNLKFQRLLKEYGLFGLGLWWVCCEVVGKSGNKFRVSPNKWWRAYLLEVSKWTDIELNKFLGVLVESNLISGSLLNKGYLAIPKMTEYADEYSNKVGRMSRQGSDNVSVDKIRLDKIRLDKIRLDKIRLLTILDLDKSPLKDSEKTILKCFLDLGYLLEENKLNDFTVWLSELQKDCPTKDLVTNAKKWRDYFESKHPKNHKNSFRNWVSKEYSDKKESSGVNYEKATEDFNKRYGKLLKK